MDHYDVVVIGGGVLGCMTARNLRRWKISTLLLEQEEDVCTGITRSNSAIVYPGYDNKAGSRKAAMTVRGNGEMENLCRELDVPFSRCGSLLVTYEESAVPRLEKKLEQGRRNGVPGLRMLSGAEAEEMEPELKPGVVGALYAPTTGTVNPWQLGIAAYDNALHNGAKAMLGTRVLGIRAADFGYEIETDKGQIRCAMVINCGGMYADRIQEMVYPTHVRLRLDGCDYLVMDRNAVGPKNVIFYETGNKGKGITVIPCVEGNLLLSGTQRPLTGFFETDAGGMTELVTQTKTYLPNLDLDLVIRSFGAVRPNPRTEAGDNISDYCIEEPADNFLSFIGIKTPGLTCSNELGMYAARKCADWLKAEPNDSFDPVRKPMREPAAGDDQIVCQCEGITRGQILDAIARGARTVKQIKRRAGSGMGRCQGGRCGWRIACILKETNTNPEPML